MTLPWRGSGWQRTKSRPSGRVRRVASRLRSFLFRCATGQCPMRRPPWCPSCSACRAGGLRGLRSLGIKAVGPLPGSPARSRRFSKLLKHRRSFTDPVTPAETPTTPKGVWSPAQTPEAERKQFDLSAGQSEEKTEEEEAIPVWTPKSAGASPVLERKKYRPINYQSPTPQRKHTSKKEPEPELPKDLPKELPSRNSADSPSHRLPSAQNPTITLLQKAREGQIPKGAQYLDERSEASISQEHVLYSVKKEYESDSEERRKIVELTPRKFDGIGPTTREGTPIALRSEVKEDNQQRWYKRMYESLHKADHDRLVPYTSQWSGSGYLSEPDRLTYDSDSRYSTLDRRRTKSTKQQSDYTLPRNNSRYSPAVRHAVNVYKNQPGRIEDYEPGHSSISEKEKQQWWDDVLDIFNGELKSAQNRESTSPTFESRGKSFTSSILKEGGYDSDSTLVFSRRSEGLQDMSLAEQKMAYKTIQKGGDVPLHGLRKPPPNKPKEEPEIEYFPISPTLTRIRIHKKTRPDEKVHEPKGIFSTYKRTARSSVTPSPPLRHSSRNNTTLRLIKSLPPPKPGSNIEFIKDRLDSRSDRGRKRDKSPVVATPKKVIKKAEPVVKSPKPEPLSKSPELKAPAEVKKAMKKPLTITVAISPKGKQLLRSAVSPKSETKKTAPTPSPTPPPKGLSPAPSDKSSRPSSKAPTPEVKKPKKEVEKKKEKKCESKSTKKPKEDKTEKQEKLEKSDKEEKVDKPDKVTEKKKSKKVDNGKKKSNGKKKDKENIPENKSGSDSHEEQFGDIPNKPEKFFQQLLLREPNVNTTRPPLVHRSSSVAERVKKFTEPHTIVFKSEPSLRNINVYLSQKKPVSESRFRSLERATSPAYGTNEFFDRLDRYDRHNDVWTTTVSSPDSARERSSSEPPHTSPTTDYSDAYDNIENISPNASRSPSVRRIRRCTSKSIEGISGVRKKFRSKSLNEADKHDSMNSLEFSDIDATDYRSYIVEKLHSSRKSTRFKELHNFYSSLERMGELEKTASNTDLRPRLRGEEVIDFDRWKQLRTKERAEAELNHLYEKLREDQREKGFLFKPKETVRWRGDSRLRSKEKSVEDLKQLFQKISENEDMRHTRESITKDVYKPLWRGNSVVDLAHSLTGVTGSRRGRPVSEDYPTRQVRPTKEIGSRLWSSLSMDQVSALKTQLSEIYCTVSNLKQERIEKMKKNLEKCEVTVSNMTHDPPSSLHVRSNSLVTPDQLYSPSVRRKQASKVSKADSISSLPYLSETEKKKLSRSLSIEVKERIKRRKHTSLVIPRETLGAVAVKKLEKKKSPSMSMETSPRMFNSLLSEDTTDKTESGKELLLVLTPEENKGDVKKMVDEWGSAEFARVVPTTESSSSSTASTVIHLGSKDNVRSQPEPSCLSDSPRRLMSSPRPLRSSQSFTDLKDLFGERRVTTYATNPLKRIHSRGYSSSESLHKCGSPDPMKYYRTYLNIARCGEVKKLKDKFESFDDLYNLFRESKHFRSDPDLSRDFLARKRAVSPASSRDLRDRGMPRINVIKKTAQLQARRSRTVPPRTPPAPGQVDRLRRHFERLGLSLLGQMYTSAPDLRDPAPMLAAQWEPRVRGRPILKTEPSIPRPYDPAIHTPVSRYQPPRPAATVTFKEPYGRGSRYTPTLYSSPEPSREYVESEVNIHYRTPVRSEAKEYIEEGELARRQAEAMRRIYQQQRRNKYIAELNDIHSRRHTDYFTPSQKSPIPLNRYDDFLVETPPPRPRDRTPEPKLVARALYNFVGQSSRELTFRRGDIIFVRRQVDKNWYEGEHNAMIGLFPINYVEIIPYDGIRTLPKKATEGQARAKFNFQAQTHLELSLVKGELVLLTRRVDENWFEGRIGNKKGIFPVSYVQVLVEPGEITYGGGKPVVAPASHSVMLNGAKDLGSQIQPPRPPSVQGSPTKGKESSQISQLLHIDTRADPVPYRAMYNYKPQNDDELELREGDVVYVMEKCDDGWYVGSLHRSGQFGTFPGNYVQRIP